MLSERSLQLAHLDVLEIRDLASCSEQCVLVDLHYSVHGLIALGGTIRPESDKRMKIY